MPNQFPCGWRLWTALVHRLACLHVWHQLQQQPKRVQATLTPASHVVSLHTRVHSWFCARWPCHACNFDDFALVHFQLNTYSHDNLTANVHTTAYKGKQSLLGVHEVQSFEMIIHRHHMEWSKNGSCYCCGFSKWHWQCSLSLTRLSPNGGCCMLYQNLERQLSIG